MNSIRDDRKKTAVTPLDTVTDIHITVDWIIGLFQTFALRVTYNIIGDDFELAEQEDTLLPNKKYGTTIFVYRL